MSADRSTSKHPTPSRGPRRRVFAGLTWKGIALVAGLCLVNGVRRVSPALNDRVDLLGWLANVGQETVWSLIVALTVTLAIVATYNLAPRTAWVRHAAVALALVVSSAIGVTAALAVEAKPDCGVDCFTAPFLSDWARYFVLCAFFTVVFVYLRAADESVARAQEADRDRARFVQRMEEARLRMLQAQIEPHFLFNTLANVRRLYQTATADGATMIDNLMRYFAIALPQMRASDSTLGREADLTESYLGIQKIRMGQRLAFDFDIPAPLREARLPPMMLVTLVENAIKHGWLRYPKAASCK